MCKNAERCVRYRMIGYRESRILNILNILHTQIPIALPVPRVVGRKTSSPGEERVLGQEWAMVGGGPSYNTENRRVTEYSV